MRARRLVAAAMALSMLLLPTSVFAQGLPGGAGCAGLEHRVFNAPWASRIGILQSLLQGCAGAFVPRLRQPSAAPSGSTAPAPPSPVSFNDLQGYGWASQSIDQLAQEGVIQGMSAHTFDPAGTLTRAQTAALITRLFALKPPANPPAFADVAPSNWAYNDIEAAAPYMSQFQVPGGIAFEPDNQTTRIDIAATLGALEIASGKASEPSAAEAQSLWHQFSDGSQVPAGLAQVAAISLQLGFMNGFPNGTFGPGQSITRAQAAVLLDRVLQAGETIGHLPPPSSTTTTGVNTLQITGISPSEAAAGTTVTISGSGFTGTNGVLFGGVPATGVTVVSDSEITAVVPQGSGTVTVTVNGSAGSGSTTFTYTGTSAAQVTAVSPAEGSAGSQVTISGSGFTGATGVFFGTTPATSVTVDSDSEITAVVPGGSGTVDVTVSVPSGTSNASVTFTYGTSSVTSGSTPYISTVSPSTGVAGSTVTLTGGNLTGTTDVYFGSSAATNVDVLSSTEISAVAPSGSGTVYVTVSGTYGSSSDSSAAEFTYSGSSSTAPTVTGLLPVSGTAGTAVEVTGSGFTNASEVYFGTTPATSFSIAGDSVLTAVAPTGTGTVYVTVTGSYGTSADTASAEFTYTGTAAAPVVTAISPTSGAPGTPVSITGSGFTGATSVTFGTTSAQFTVANDGSIAAVAPTPTGNSTTVTVVVTGPNGTSSSSGPTFTYTGCTASVSGSVYCSGS